MSGTADGQQEAGTTDVVRKPTPRAVEPRWTPGPTPVPPAERRFAARLEPFDSYCQNPHDIDAGFRKFGTYYRANYLPRLPRDRGLRIAVLSCGPGYLVKTLLDAGYTNVTGIDAHAGYVQQGLDRGLPCAVGRAFDYLADRPGQFDLIIPEQELNHLTEDETLEFLGLCVRALRPGGQVLVYAINGGNPLTSPEHLSHNIDHFYSVTDYSLRQLLELGGFTDVRPFACELYVFWKRPANYVGWLITHGFEWAVRGMLFFYGKRMPILSKRIAALATAPPTAEPA
jgi:SAM-dependent methyltransferase